MAKCTNIAVEYMSELINYGGTLVPRGYAYQLLLKVAKAQGHDRPQLMADRWMQGYDLKAKARKWQSAFLSS